MIDRQYGKYILVCDNCGKSIDCDSFQDAVDVKKTDGWRSMKGGSEWVDLCPYCDYGSDIL